MEAKTIQYWKYAVFVVPIAFFACVRWGFHFEGVYGQDSYEYLRYAKELHEGIYHNGTIGPFFWPVIYSLSGAILPFGNTAFWLQFISLLSFLGILLLLIRLMKTKGIPEKTIYPLLLIGVVISPYFLRPSVLVMSDMLAAFFLLLSYYGLQKWKLQNRWFDLLVFSTAGGAALMTRHACIPLLFIFGLECFYHIWKNKLYNLRFVLALMAGFFPFIPYLLLPRGAETILQQGYLDKWSIANLFRTSLESADGTQNNWVPNALYIFSPIGHAGYFLMGSVLIAYQVLKRKLMISGGWLLLSIGIYLLFIGGFAIQNQRFFVIVFPLIILLFAPAFDLLYQTLNRTRRTLLLGGLIVLQTGVFGYSFRKFLKFSNMERATAQHITAHHPNATIYGLGIEPALTFHGVKNTYREFFNGLYPNYQSGDVLVINPINLEEQWANENPGKNWAYVQQNYALKKIQDLDFGMKIYVVE